MAGVSFLGAAWFFYATAAPGQLEAEQGTRTVNAQTVSDSSASNSSAVKFQAASEGGCASSTPNTPDGPDPWGGCWPGPVSTGIPAGTTLQRVPEDVDTAEAAGGSNADWRWDYVNNFIRYTGDAVLDGLIVNGNGYVNGNPQVTITNTRYLGCVNGPSSALGPGSIVRDSEIFGDCTGLYTKCDSTSPCLVERTEFMNSSHSIHPNGYTTIKDSYFHDLALPSPSDTPSTIIHQDVFMVESGRYVTFTHNFISTWVNNASIFIQNYNQSDANGVGNFTIANNYIGGVDSTVQNQEGPSFRAILIENKGFYGRQNTVLVQNNVFNRGYSGTLITIPQGAPAPTGNVYTDGASANSSVYYYPCAHNCT